MLPALCGFFAFSCNLGFLPSRTWSGRKVWPTHSTSNASGNILGRFIDGAPSLCLWLQLQMGPTAWMSMDNLTKWEQGFDGRRGKGKAPHSFQRKNVPRESRVVTASGRARAMSRTLGHVLSRHPVSGIARFLTHLPSVKERIRSVQFSVFTNIDQMQFPRKMLSSGVRRSRMASSHYGNLM